MPVMSATEEDLPLAIGALAEAFANEPMFEYLFQGDAASKRPLAEEFFSILMLARLKLRMPVLVLKEAGAVHGAVMGYDTHRPEWPASLKQRMAEVEARPGVAQRFARYEEISIKYEPARPHYYLGVVGVHPARQGNGCGVRLIDAFTALSDNDPTSSGTTIDTASEANANYYMRRGFELAGTERLDANTSLWCLFRPAR